MSAKPTQRDKVLRLLKDAGGRGVHTFELRQAMIGNPSQRIAELEGSGCVIEHSREKLHGTAQGTRYVLKSVGGGASSSSEDQADRDHGTPSALVAAPSALTNQSAGGERDGVGPLTLDALPPADQDAVSLFGDAAVPQSPTSAYDPYSEAA